jgi:hypothetical protein
LAIRQDGIAMTKNRLQAALVCCFATAWLHGNAAFAADGKVLDLKRISEGKGAKAAPGAAIRWDANVKGKAALFTRSVVWLEESNFSDGTIECDILGKSVPRGSNFLGIAFRGVDETTFDCVYFRPFNFRAQNPENASHAVQYI